MGVHLIVLQSICVIFLAVVGCDPGGSRSKPVPVPADSTSSAEITGDATAAPADGDSGAVHDEPDTGPSPVDAAGPAPDEGSPVGPSRIIAIGDLHGDLAATTATFRMAGIMDDKGHWIGGDLIVVQVGDQLDRGDDEPEVMELIERLDEEARAAGGRFHALIGNHETMNVEADLRYVTPGGFADFADTPHDPQDPTLESFDPEQRGRVAAFRPGGPWAMRLSSHDVVLVVDDTVFVHGSVLPEHVSYGVDLINEVTRAWFRDEIDQPEVMLSGDCPVWSRQFSDEVDDEDCAMLEGVLHSLSVSRMVVGHTPHLGGIASKCDGKVWVVDVGLADYYGGTPAALSIIDGEVFVMAW